MKNKDKHPIFEKQAILKMEKRRDYGVCPLCRKYDCRIWNKFLDGHGVVK